jgi:hypothetical protein
MNGLLRVECNDHEEGPLTTFVGSIEERSWETQHVFII